MVDQRTLRRVTAMAFAVVCLLTMVLVGADLHVPALRLPLALLMVGVVPGWAVVSYLDLDQVSLLWISSIGLSLAITLLGTLVMQMVKAWDPRAAMYMLSLGCLILLGHHLWRTRR